MKTDAEKVKHCEAMLGFLKEERRPVESMVDNIIEFVHHSRRKVVDKTRSKGDKTGTAVYDGTALSAARLASDGIFGYLCSQSLHWFDFALPGRLNFPRVSGMRAWSGKRMDEYPEVKRWLSECEEVQYAAFSRSNFYDFMPTFIREGMTIGTATANIEEDLRKGRIIFRLPHFREIFINQNRFGEVDTQYRSFEMQMRHLVDRFGEKFLDLKQDYRKQYELNPYRLKKIIRAVFPRTDYDPGRLNGKNRPVASLWVLQDGLPDLGKRLLEESGYYEPADVTWRWYTNTDEEYGRSPAWDAYVDIMTANQQGKTNLLAGHKMVDPPMIMPEDLKGRYQNRPGGETYIEGAVTKDRIPIPAVTGIQLPYGLELQDRTAKMIKEHFHVDFFLMLYQAAFNKVELTATQVVGMQGEQAAVLGTRIGRLQTEALNPIMDRVFSIEVRAGRTPEPPAILQDMGGRPIEIDYTGPLAQSQKKLFKVQGIRAGVELAGQIATVFPYAMDQIDGDVLMKEGLDSVGFPIKAIRDADAVTQIRAVRQQAQEQQARLEQLELASKATQKLSKPVEEGSPLETIINEE